MANPFFYRLLALALVVFTLTACGQPASTPVTNADSDSDSDATVSGAKPNCQFDSAATDQVFDVVILNGRVMDPECDFDGVRNVGVSDGTITLITQGDISGTENIKSMTRQMVF